MIEVSLSSNDTGLTDRIVIFAPNVWTGGGLILLQTLLQADWPADQRCAFLDERAKHLLDGHADKFSIDWVAPGVRSRLRAERNLSKRSRPTDATLCFHNLPPIFQVKGKTYCYLQNAYIVNGIDGERLRGRAGVRTAIERAVARVFCHRCDRILVQTPTMQANVARWLGDRSRRVDMLPILPQLQVETAALMPSGDASDHLRPDFLFVSDGQPHKNHRRLFAAWQLLAKAGVYPGLVVTLHPDRDKALRQEVSRLAKEGLAVEDIGVIPHAELKSLYRRTGALIFPSTGESFGNPLIEARESGLPILASELDYVRDVCAPVQTFDPFSERSIARAVQRFLDIPEKLVQPLRGDEFAAALMAFEASGKS